MPACGSCGYSALGAIVVEDPFKGLSGRLRCRSTLARFYAAMMTAALETVAYDFNTCQSSVFGIESLDAFVAASANLFVICIFGRTIFTTLPSARAVAKLKVCCQ
jgi:hypothetical protein